MVIYGIETYTGLQKMNRVNEPSLNTLAQIQRRTAISSAQFEKERSMLAHRLQSSILSRQAADHSQLLRSSFGSAWLPGPLSYPWLLMFAGIPIIIERFFLH